MNTDQYLTGLVASSNGYYYGVKINPDGTPGVDYFHVDPAGNLSPITREDYGQGTGVDPGLVESQARNDFQSYMNTGGNRAVDLPRVGGKIDSKQSVASGGGTTYQPQPTTLFDQDGNPIGTYDLANPNDRLRYYTDKKSILEKIRDEQIAQYNKDATNAFSEAKLTTEKNISEIDQQLSDLETEAKNYVTDYNKQVNAFTDTKALGDVNRQQFFTKLSPNAYQSSQGTSQQYAENQYVQGLGDMATQARDTVGGDYLATGDVNTLDPNSTFGRTRTTLKNQKQDVQSSYNAYLTNASDSLNKNIKSTNQYVTSNLNTMANQFSPTDKSQGIDPFRYNRVAVNTPSVSNTDLSSYTPYVGFNGSPVTASTAAPVKTVNAFSSTTPIDAYLGKTKLDTNSKDRLRAYLLGK